MKKERFIVTGMSCAACSARVDKVVAALKGVRNVSVNLLKNAMTVEFDEERLSVSGIIAAVEKAGYGASLTDASPLRQDRENRLKTRLILSAVLTLSLMYVAMGKTDSSVIQLLLASIVIVLNGAYFINGFKALLRREPNMDSLID